LNKNWLRDQEVGMFSDGSGQGVFDGDDSGGD
jgi:hypothetical protein